MMFGCEVTVRQNMESSSNIQYLRVYIIGSPEVLATIQFQWQRRLIIRRISQESVSSVIVILVVMNLKLIRNRKASQIN